MRNLSWFIWLSFVKVFHYVFCIIEFVSISVILIKIFIDVFLFDFVFKTISQFLKIQFVFNYSFLFTFNNNNFKNKILLIRQWIDNDEIQKLKMKNIIYFHDFK